MKKKKDEILSIYLNFPVSEEEYLTLDEQFGQLCNYAAWQLIKKNTRNNSTDEPEDYIHELKMAVIRAGSYYKRQVYIESCLEVLQKVERDEFTGKIIDELCKLWLNRTRHGANRQKFGDYQEAILDSLIKKLVNKEIAPNKQRILRLDTKFKTYCKAIIWNHSKTMGKKITREKVIRAGQVSLSDYDYLVTN